MEKENKICSAKIIADSIGPGGVRLTTFLLEYPRIIHSELMTHRVFSRNASSSRAIPGKVMIQKIKENMFVPIRIQKSHKGMQGMEYMEGKEEEKAKQHWRMAGRLALSQAEYMLNQDITKQLVNRILEPYSFIKVVVTSTEWTNFFELRDHEAAEIHIQALSKEIKMNYLAGTPKTLSAGEWHLPFVLNEEKGLPEDDLIKISVARCARTSYYDNFGKQDTKADIELHDRLTKSKPQHLSPSEHQAKAIDAKVILNNPYEILPEGVEIRKSKHEKEVWSGNLRGWIQYRKMLELK